MRKIIALIVLITFLVTGIVPPSYAQTILNLPEPGSMVLQSPVFQTAHLKGITIHPEDALRFDFLIDQGDVNLSESDKQAEYTKLVKYFLASLTVPDENQWVNLSPYEQDRIIAEDFGNTEMGRDLLAQDYILKQLTASMIHPDESLGAAFWEKIYAQVEAKYGDTSIPVDTFNKVWISVDKADVVESGNSVFVVGSHLKVQLESDYLANEQSAVNSQQSTEDNSFVKEIAREIVIPALEKEVNEGKNFAQLRQIYSAMILATWYKRAMKESLLGQVFTDKARVKGVDQDPATNQQIYDQYVAAFKKGVFSLIKEDADRLSGEAIPRKYFSGGAGNNLVKDKAMNVRRLGEINGNGQVPMEIQLSLLAEMGRFTSNGETTAYQPAVSLNDLRRKTADPKTGLDTVAVKLRTTDEPDAVVKGRTRRGSDFAMSQDELLTATSSRIFEEVQSAVRDAQGFYQGQGMAPEALAEIVFNDTFLQPFESAAERGQMIGDGEIASFVQRMVERLHNADIEVSAGRVGDNRPETAKIYGYLQGMVRDLPQAIQGLREIKSVFDSQRSYDNDRVLAKAFLEGVVSATTEHAAKQLYYAEAEIPKERISALIYQSYTVRDVKQGIMASVLRAVNKAPLKFYKIYAQAVENAKTAVQAAAITAALNSGLIATRVIQPYEIYDQVAYRPSYWQRLKGRAMVWLASIVDDLDLFTPFVLAALVAAVVIGEVVSEMDKVHTRYTQPGFQSDRQWFEDTFGILGADTETVQMIKQDQELRALWEQYNAVTDKLIRLTKAFKDAEAKAVEFGITLANAKDMKIGLGAAEEQKRTARDALLAANEALWGARMEQIPVTTKIKQAYWRTTLRRYETIALNQRQATGRVANDIQEKINRARAEVEKYTKMVNDLEAQQIEIVRSAKDEARLMSIMFQVAETQIVEIITNQPPATAVSTNVDPKAVMLFNLSGFTNFLPSTNQAPQNLRVVQADNGPRAVNLMTMTMSVTTNRSGVMEGLEQKAKDAQKSYREALRRIPDVKGSALLTRSQREAFDNARKAATAAREAKETAEQNLRNYVAALKSVLGTDQAMTVRQGVRKLRNILANNPDVLSNGLRRISNENLKFIADLPTLRLMTKAILTDVRDRMLASGSASEEVNDIFRELTRIKHQSATTLEEAKADLSDYLATMPEALAGDVKNVAVSQIPLVHTEETFNNLINVLITGVKSYRGESKLTADETDAIIGDFESMKKDWAMKADQAMVTFSSFEDFRKAVEKGNVQQKLKEVMEDPAKLGRLMGFFEIAFASSKPRIDRLIARLQARTYERRIFEDSPADEYNLQEYGLLYQGSGELDYGVVAIVRAAVEGARSGVDSAMKKDYGGIDLNAENLELSIKRDGNGVALPIVQQDPLKLQNIQGFVPVIIDIKTGGNIPILQELLGG